MGYAFLRKSRDKIQILCFSFYGAGSGYKFILIVQWIQTVQDLSLDTFTLLLKDNSIISIVLWEEEMAFFRKEEFLRLLEEKLQPLDVQNLRYILEDSLTG